MHGFRATSTTTLIAGTLLLASFGNARADLDNDCRDELLVGRTAGPNMRFTVQELAGGTLSEVDQTAHGWGNDRAASSAAIGDFDGDGQSELAVGRNIGGNMRVAVYRLSDDRIQLISSVGYDWGDSRGAMSMAAGDFDGDGDDELAVGRDPGGNMRIRIYQLTAGVVQVLQEVASGAEGWGDDRGASAMAAGDVDGDGRDELAVGRTPGENMRIALYRLENGEIKLMANTAHGWGDNRGVASMAVGDADGDGLEDILAGRNAGPNMRFALYRYDKTAGRLQFMGNSGHNWGDDRGASAVAFGDVDLDGRLEFVVGRSRGPNQRFGVYRWNSDKEEIELLAKDGQNWGDNRGADAAVFGDFDGDGVDEFAIGRSPGPNMRFAVYRFDPSNDSIQRIDAGGSGWGNNRGASVLAARRVGFRQDVDGDGLYDRWEKDGMDLGCDGTVELDLPRLGANPYRKTLFVELDFMQQHRPRQDAIDDVIESFADAPVSNPDGSEGIDLLIQVDEQLNHQGMINLGNYVNARRNDSFGTRAERNASNAADILAAKEQAFRYSLWVHQYSARPGSSGNAVNAGNFIVSLGAGHWGTNPAGTHNVGTRAQQAGTFMHELGHTLGLAHGGDEGTNCKPNYLSIMSYAFQTALIPHQDLPFGRIDYSDQALNTLDESNLDEPDGIGNGRHRTRWSDPAGNARTGDADGPLDWNQNGSATDTGISVDLNALPGISGCPASSGESYDGHDDWRNLDYKFWDSLRDGGVALVAASSATFPDDELTAEDARKLKACNPDQRCEPVSVGEWRQRLEREPSQILLYSSCISHYLGGADPAELRERLGEPEGAACLRARSELVLAALNLCSGAVAPCCTVRIGDETRDPPFADHVVERVVDLLAPARLSAENCRMAADLASDVNDSESVSPDLSPTPSGDRDCIGYDPAELAIVGEGPDGVSVGDGRSILALLDDRGDAKAFIKQASEHTQQCFIGRDNDRAERDRYIMTYYRGESGLSPAPIQNPDCLPYDPDNLVIEQSGDRDWLLTNGSAMHLFASREDAERGLAVARRYGAHCFIGRDNQRDNRLRYIHEYWRR